MSALIETFGNSHRGWERMSENIKTNSLDGVNG